MSLRARNLLLSGNIKWKAFSNVLGGLILIGGSFFMYPIYKAKTTPKLSDSDKQLSGQSVMRGNYINTGSKDMGPDPNVKKTQ